MLIGVCRPREMPKGCLVDAEPLEVMDMTKSVPPSTDRPGSVLQGLLDLRPTPVSERMAITAEDAVAQGLAVAKVYAFVSIDYAGASSSWVFDGGGDDAVGGFQFDGGTEVSLHSLSWAGYTRFWPSRTRPLASRQASIASV
jgi:hypothetical protein